jgi:hypothetical protein
LYEYRRQRQTINEAQLAAYLTGSAPVTLTFPFKLGPYCNTDLPCSNKRIRHRTPGYAHYKHPIRKCGFEGGCNHRTYNRREATVKNGERK